AQPLRAGADVHPEVARIEVGGEEGVDGVRLAPPLPDLLEQPGAHPTPEGEVEEVSRVALRIRVGDARAPQAEADLLERLLLDPPGRGGLAGAASRGPGPPRAAGAPLRRGAGTSPRAYRLGPPRPPADPRAPGCPPRRSARGRADSAPRGSAGSPPA